MMLHIVISVVFVKVNLITKCFSYIAQFRLATLKIVKPTKAHILCTLIKRFIIVCTTGSVFDIRQTHSI